MQHVLQNSSKHREHQHHQRGDSGKGPLHIDGLAKDVCLDWKVQVGVYGTTSAADICDLLTGQQVPNPTVGGNLARWKRTNIDLFVFFVLAANGGDTTTAVRRHNSNNPEDGLRDRPAVKQAFEERYDAGIKAARQDLHEELVNTKMKHGQDPDDFHVHHGYSTMRSVRYWGEYFPERLGHPFSTHASLQHSVEYQIQ